MDQETSSTEDFPRSRKVDKLGAIEDENGNFGRAVLAVACGDQSHPAVWTVAGLIECKLVARLTAGRTNVGLCAGGFWDVSFECRGTESQRAETADCNHCARTAFDKPSS